MWNEKRAAWCFATPSVPFMIAAKANGVSHAIDAVLLPE